MDKLPPVRTNNKLCYQRSSKDHIILTPDFLKELTADQLFGVNRINIKFNNRKQKRTGGYLPKLIRRKVYVDELFTDRTMDSGSDGLDFPDDAIDKVARANSVRDNGTILPQVRASPCPLHTKYEKRTEPSNNSTSVLTIPTGQMKRTTSNPTLGKEVLVGKDTENVLDARNSRMRSSLPGKNMPSKEFVMTWLMYGSDPGERNHFPELVKTQSSTKSKNKQKRDLLTKDIAFGE